MNINPFLVECRHEVLELKSFSISKDEERASEVIAVYGYVKLKQEVFRRNWFFLQKRCYQKVLWNYSISHLLHKYYKQIANIWYAPSEITGVDFRTLPKGYVVFLVVSYIFVNRFYQNIKSNQINWSELDI